MNFATRLVAGTLLVLVLTVAVLLWTARHAYRAAVVANDAG